MRRITITVLGAVCLLVEAAVQGAPANSIYNPNDYTSLGSLVYSSGTLQFNTLDGSVGYDAGNDGTYETTLSSGVVGQANASNKVKMAVFTYSSINLGASVTINVVGNQGIVLASQSGMTFGASLNVFGTAGGDNDTAASWSAPGHGRGGPGADGSTYTDSSITDAGNVGVQTESAPPGPYSGDGGFTRYGTNRARYGRGYGGGAGGYSVAKYASAGSYGGQGGNGSFSRSPTYGDVLLANLYGGSGGGGQSRNSDAKRAGGGGGGGSVELVALDVLAVSGQINAYGGAGGYDVADDVTGGGGSGGGILLAGRTVNILAGAVIDASGGNGGHGTSSNGGGGGRVAIYTGLAWTKPQETWIQTDGDDGGDGLDDGGYTVNNLVYNDDAIVDVTGGVNQGLKGSFYLVSLPPPAGTMISIR